jgi:hypothetical protein
MPSEMTPLVIRRTESESWREAVIRVAKPWGLVWECLETFDAHIRNGSSDSEAAWCALYDWDLTDYEPEKK